MQRITCEGAPRDLGLDQGRACRAAIRADARALGWEAAGGWLEALRRPRGMRPRRSLVRDLARHFPHLDERTTGLAAGADLPREALLVLLEEELGEGPVLAAGVAPGRAGVQLVARLHTPFPPTGLVARIARPDGGYPYLALTRPGLAAALAGVNAHGLAGVVEGIDPPASRGRERCGVSGALLLDQCLERLDSVEKALEWCERRPGGGRARLVFADATGATAALELDGDTRVRCEAPALAADEGERDGLVVLEPAAHALEWREKGGAVERIEL